MILLSHILDSDTPTYGNRDKFIVEETSSIADGASANSSKWTFTTNHIGTHIDLPKHFFDNGQTVTDVPLGFWYSEKVQLIDVPCSTAKLIEIDDIHDEIELGTEILLIRTGYERFRKHEKYWNDNPGLSAGFGKWLKANRPNIHIVGFDFISLTSWKHKTAGKMAHHEFLNDTEINKPISIVEDMSLENITGRLINILISPIMVMGGNGSTVTVFANINRY
jgi:kynurenine formamidase